MFLRPPPTPPVEQCQKNGTLLKWGIPNQTNLMMFLIMLMNVLVMVNVLRITTDLFLPFHPPATLRLVPESELTVNHHLAHSVSGADWVRLMMLVMIMVLMMTLTRSCPKLSSSTERRLRPITTGEDWGTPSESWEDRDYSGKPGKMVIGDYSGNVWETSFEHLT